MSRRAAAGGAKAKWLHRAHRLHKPDKHLPEAWSLRLVPWQIFATLTFKGAASHALAGKIIVAWVRQLARRQGIPEKRVFLCFRRERGTSKLHWHYHALLGGLGTMSPEVCGLATALWTARGGGFASITLFDSRDGVGYALKKFANYGRSRSLSSDDTDIPTFSDSVMAFLRPRLH